MTPASAARTTSARKRKPLAPVVTPFAVRRFTLEEYHDLIARGTLKPGDPYELLNGVLKHKMPQNSPHASAAGKLERLFWRLIPDDAFLRTQKPITLPDSDSEPEPDLAVVHGPAERYDDRHPGPADILLLIEVAVTSLAEDLGEKRRTYAAAMVPVYWVVNIPEWVIEVFSHPRSGKSPGYRTRTAYAPGAAVPVVLGKVAVGEVAVAAILP